MPPPYQRGYKPLPAAQAAALHAAAFARHGHLMRMLAQNATPPAAFSTVDQGWIGPVVDQGNCGSCYLVSSADAFTGALIKAGWGKADGSIKISDQYGLDCQNFGGCGGGDEAEVIDFMKSKGFPAERYVDPASGTAKSDYPPYTAGPSKCRLPGGAKMWQLQDWGYVAGDQGSGPATLDQWKAALLKYGTLSIALDASSFDSYSSGVISRLGNSIDHAITAVGWDDGKQAVHCRNNWGTGWGEQGYCWIAYGAVPQIVEPIWLLAPPAVVPPPVPPPGPGPVPPPPPVPPIPPIPPGTDFTGALQFVQGRIQTPGATNGGLNLGPIFTAITEILSGNPAGWTDLFNAIIGLFGGLRSNPEAAWPHFQAFVIGLYMVAAANPGVAPWLLPIIDAIIQAVGSMFGLPKSVLDAIVAVVNQLFGGGKAAEFVARHSNIKVLA